MLQVQSIEPGKAAGEGYREIGGQTLKHSRTIGSSVLTYGKVITIMHSNYYIFQNN